MSIEHNRAIPELTGLVWNKIPLINIRYNVKRVNVEEYKLISEVVNSFLDKYSITDNFNKYLKSFNPVELEYVLESTDTIKKEKLTVSKSGMIVGVGEYLNFIHNTFIQTERIHLFWKVSKEIVNLEMYASKKTKTMTNFYNEIIQITLFTNITYKYIVDFVNRFEKNLKEQEFEKHLEEFKRGIKIYSMTPYKIEMCDQDYQKMNTDSSVSNIEKSLSTLNITTTPPDSPDFRVEF